MSSREEEILTTVPSSGDMTNLEEPFRRLGGPEACDTSNHPTTLDRVCIGPRDTVWTTPSRSPQGDKRARRER